MRGTAHEIAKAIQAGELLEAGGHNILVYSKLHDLRNIVAKSAKTFLKHNEIVLFATQYDTIDNIKLALQNEGVDVQRYIDDGTLFIIDAQEGYQGADTYGTFKLGMSLVLRVKKEKRRGLTWMGDMGSFFAFEKVHELINYEMSCPTKYEEPIKTVCCYHKGDFDKLREEEQNRLIEHHFKTMFAE